jgi:hypothetical protein
MNFRHYAGSKWQDIGMACPRCQCPLLREVRHTGRPTNHFTCKRYGCTWPDFSRNIGVILVALERRASTTLPRGSLMCEPGRIRTETTRKVADND